jgi:hypothetical protein
MSLTRERSVRSRRIVQYEYGSQVRADGGEILGVRPKVKGAVLAVVPGTEEKKFFKVWTYLKLFINIFNCCV